jgi:hypothetical protein
MFRLKSNRTSVATIQHNSEEDTRRLKVLVPYSYEAALPTSCNVEAGPLHQLTLLCNSKKLDAKLAVGTVNGRISKAKVAGGMAAGRPRDDDMDDATGGSETAGATQRIVLAETMLIYVISGSMEVELQDQERRVINAGETLIAEQKDAEVPFNLRMCAVAPSLPDNDPVNADGNYDKYQGTLKDDNLSARSLNMTVDPFLDVSYVLIEITKRADPSVGTDFRCRRCFWLLTVFVHRQLYMSPSLPRAPRRKGSIIVFE